MAILFQISLLPVDAHRRSKSQPEKKMFWGLKIHKQKKADDFFYDVVSLKSPADVFPLSQIVVTCVQTFRDKKQNNSLE